MNYKAIFSDIDGTLVPVGPYTKLSDKVREALLKAKSKVGIHLVTGRPYSLIQEIVTDLQLDDLCIINGGTQVINARDGSVVWEKPIDQGDFTQLVELSKKHGVVLLVNDGGIEYQQPKETNFANPIGVQFQYLDDAQADTILAEVREIKGVSGHKIFSWKAEHFDIYITHAEATKQHAIEIIMDKKGLRKEEAIGVGDGNNDVPLMNMCGLKIAVENATGGLKAVCNDTVPSVDDGGVATLVEKYILKQD